jgi:membrane protein YdbS with pleckstrin-like domain
MIKVIENMAPLKPSSRYSIRLYVLISLGAIFLLVSGSLLAWILSLDWAHAVHINRILQVFIFLVLLGYVLLLFFAHHYYQSITYKLMPEEIALERGVWVQCVQHISWRGIVGIKIKRDFFDRCLEIGTLELVLRGPSQNQISAARMVGLSDVDAQYRKISDILLNYWGKPTLQAETNSLESQVVFSNSLTDLQ